jgi:hypothetical protein
MRARVLLFLGLLLGPALLLGAGPAAAQNRFSLVNNTGEVIERVFDSPSRLSNWGSDVLGQGVLQPGQSHWVVPQLSDCLLDVKVVYRGGREETRWQVNACQLSRVVWGGGGGAVAGAGGNPSFRFVNGAGATVNELYVSLSSDADWGRDRLGSGVLPPGGVAEVNLPAGKGCLVDLRVVYADGRATERRRVETCSVTDLTFR